jgi:CheY-like chemotaxis protein
MMRTLLLADENITTHRIVALTFAEHDVRVISAVDGIEAMERIERDRPDIILADAHLTKMDGYELARYVTTRPSLAGIPVLLLTGAFDTIDESRVKQSGAAGVIVKPFEPAVVINRVKALLGFGAKPAAPVVTPALPPASAEPNPRPPGPIEGVPRRVRPSPRPEPVVVRTPRDPQIPATPTAWDELRHESRPRPDAAVSDGHSGTAQDYFERLDAAFDTLDAQLAGRLPNRPASAGRDTDTSGGETSSDTAQRNTGAIFGEGQAPAARGDPHAISPDEEIASGRRGSTQASPQPRSPEKRVANTAEPPVFEVDADWFSELPSDDQESSLSASSQGRRLSPSRPVLVAPPPPVVSDDVPAAQVAPDYPVIPVLTARVPLGPQTPDATGEPAAPEHDASAAVVETGFAPVTFEDETDAAARGEPAERMAPSAPDASQYLTKPHAPVAPVARAHRTAPTAPGGPGAPSEPVTLADLFDALLEAEERRDRRAQPVEVIAAPVAQTADISDAAIDRIARRVAERLADGVLIDAVRNGVAAITERLVRDEIERTRTKPPHKT